VTCLCQLHFPGRTAPLLVRTMQGLVVNEFHGYPGDFYFTAPLDTGVLPPLRITGDGVLREFGFEQVRLTWCSATFEHSRTLGMLHEAGFG
jgi:hypothetical protein